MGTTYKINDFRARCRITYKGEPFIKELGSFLTQEGAFLAYKECKEEEMRRLASEWVGRIDQSAYTALMNYKVEIND